MSVSQALTATAGQIELLEYNTEGITSVQTVGSVGTFNAATGVTGIDVTRGSAVVPTSASYSINSSGWFSTVGNPNANYEFGFTTSQAYDVDQLTVGLRSSATGPGLVDLQYQLNGSSTWVQLQQFTMMGTAYDNAVVNLSSIGTVTSELLFRLVVDPASGAAGNNVSPPPSPPYTFADTGTFRFASYENASGVYLNPEITGTAVPEPSSVILGGLGIMAVIGAVSRRRISQAA